MFKRTEGGTVSVKIDTPLEYIYIVISQDRMFKRTEGCTVSVKIDTILREATLDAMVRCAFSLQLDFQSDKLVLFTLGYIMTF